MRSNTKTPSFVCFVFLVLACFIALLTPVDAFFGFHKVAKCVSDKECKQHEYCDHAGVNQIGQCKDGKANNQ